jgi:hypothetical protein
MSATIHLQPEQSSRVDQIEIDAIGYRDLLMSRRRLVRVDRYGEDVRRLYDLDSGETFYIDERRISDVQG